MFSFEVKIHAHCANNFMCTGVLMRASEAMHGEEYENDAEEIPSTASMLRDYRIKGRSSLKKFVNKNIACY